MESPTFTTQTGSFKSAAHKLPVCGSSDYGFMFCLYFSSLRLLSQSSQSWLRACGLLWTTRPSVPLISGARSRDTLPNSWAASKSSLSPSALTLCAQSTWGKKRLLTSISEKGIKSFYFCLFAVNRTPRSFCAAYWTVSTTRWTEWRSARRCSSRTLTTSRKSAPPNESLITCSVTDTSHMPVRLTGLQSLKNCVIIYN